MSPPNSAASVSAPNTSTAAARAPASATTRTKPRGPGIRQTMSDLHIWTGLLAGWILYAMFLTGTVSFFRNEISQWMRPELAAQVTPPDSAEVAGRVVATLAQIAPDSPQWSIGLPGARDNTASAFWRGGRRFENGTFDPATGDRVSARTTAGGDFFYRFHFDLHYMSPIWGRWIAGICAMFMLVAIISGVITHKKIFVDFFTFRWGKGQRSWLDAHNALSVFGLPFHLMITYTGLITLMLLYMPWGSSAAYPNAQDRSAVTAEMGSFVPAGKPSGQAAPLVSVPDLVRQAEARWGQGQVGRVTVNLPGDAEARVVVVRSDDTRVSVSPRYLLFDGVSGELLQAKESVGAAAETRGVLYGLHLGRFADLGTRWLYFLVSLAGTAMVGSGLVLWTVKRRQKLPDPQRPYFGFRVVERLNIAAIAGLSVAMTAFLWGNRLLPLDMDARRAAEINLFFIVWGCTLVYGLLRPARRAWIELWSLAAVLLLLTPVLSAFTTDRGLWNSLTAGDWVFAGFDLSLLVLGALHVALAVRAARHKPRIKPARPAAREPRAPKAPPTAQSPSSPEAAA